jgi:endonuclease/exonuclease/phosphatase family metal-dependent hydrolase
MAGAPLIRVATYNIHHGAPRRGPVDNDALVDTCRRLEADVLALQEVYHRAWRTRFADQAGRIATAVGGVHVFASNVALGPVGRYGNALVVRGRIESWKRLALSSSAGREQRGAIVARVDVGGVALTVAATHLQNERPESGHPEARAQLAEVLSALAAWPRPWLLVGDLNLSPDEALDAVEAAGLGRVESPPSFPADRPRQSIDWVAVADLVPIAAEVPDVRTSDHRPVVATLAAVPHGS